MGLLERYLSLHVTETSEILFFQNRAHYLPFHICVNSYHLTQCQKLPTGLPAFTLSPYILFAAQLPEWSFKVELRSSHCCDQTVQWLLMSLIMKAQWAVWWPLPSDVLSLLTPLEPLSPRGPRMCQACCSSLWVFTVALCPNAVPKHLYDYFLHLLQVFAQTPVSSQTTYLNTLRLHICPYPTFPP